MKMKKYISIDNGLLMLCISLFLFMMFLCSQLLFCGYEESESPKQNYIIEEDEITVQQMNQIIEILRDRNTDAYIDGIYMRDGELFDRKAVRLWLYRKERAARKEKTMIDDPLQELDWENLSEDDRSRIIQETNERETEFEKIYLVFSGKQEPDESFIRSITSCIPISKSNEQSPERGNYLQSFQDKMMLYSSVGIAVFGIVCMFSFSELWIYSRQREWMICRIYGFRQGDIAKGILKELLAVYGASVGCGIVLVLIYHWVYHYAYMITGKWMFLFVAEIMIVYILFSGYVISRECKIMKKDNGREIL